MPTPIEGNDQRSTLVIAPRGVEVEAQYDPSGTPVGVNVKISSPSAHYQLEFTWLAYLQHVASLTEVLPELILRRDVG